VARSKSFLRRVLRIIAVVAIMSLLLSTAWIVHLDRVVTREFWGRLWSVPARVYAEPLDLYVGAPIAAD
jgi:penicillin-binding protein 1B